jgi:hypothetical protein
MLVLYICLLINRCSIGLSCVNYFLRYMPSFVMLLITSYFLANSCHLYFIRLVRQRPYIVRKINIQYSGLGVNWYSRQHTGVASTRSRPKIKCYIVQKGGVEKFLVGCKRHYSVSFKGVWVKAFHTIGGVKRNFGGVEHFIRGVSEILRGGG